MNFELPERAQLVAESVRSLAQKLIAPHVSEWDREGHMPVEVLRELGKHGLMGMLVPEEYGGAGMGYIEYVTAIIELAKVDPSIALSVAAHNSLCVGHLLLFASEEQKRKWLVPLAKGEWLGAWALTEPFSGSDAAGLRTTAIRSNGKWILNGTKMFTTHGASADLVVVFARTSPSEDKRRGISAFAILKGTPGLKAGRKEDKLGMRASETAEVILEDCEVPESHIIGKEGEGFLQALKVLDGGRISIAALGVGIAEGAFHHALKYSVEREQFGKRIAEFQAISFKLAEMATAIEAAKNLTYYAAWLKDTSQDPIPKYSSMAKYYASEVAVWAANEAVQIHGGYGYIKEFPVEKFYRDAKLCTIGEGTSEIQKLVISKELLKSVGYR